MATTDEQPSMGASRSETLLLIMHDVPSGFSLLTALLQKTPYEVFLATERFQAVDFLKYITPLLVIFEYQLPGMNGIELYDLLHAQEKFVTLPAIMFSDGDPRREQEMRQRKIGSLRKPFTLDELVACIQQVLA